MNKLEIIGRVGRDPLMTYTPDGMAMTKMSVAVSRKIGKGAEKKEETTWISVTAFGTLGETMIQYVKKGDQVFLSGRASTRAYTDKNGVVAASLDLTVEHLELLGNKRDETEDPGVPVRKPWELERDGIVHGIVPVTTSTGEDFPF